MKTAGVTTGRGPPIFAGTAASKLPRLAVFTDPLAILFAQLRQWQRNRFLVVDSLERDFAVLVSDVLSFDLGGSRGGGVDGTVVVSTETACREAACRGHDAVAEALLYVVHGTLHLLGFDDDTPEAAAQMHATEDRVLSAMGLGPVFVRGS